MIIECDQCNTKFRLDDSRISPNGVKVRCTKCQNVFVVTPPPPPEEVLMEEVFGPDTPFMEKGREGFDSAAAKGPQGNGEAEQESAPWGVFNSGDEDNIEKQETGDEGQSLEDGRDEAPELSFGGPDFSSLSGLSGGGPASGKETGERIKERADGPWFTGAVGEDGEDDGFPEDGPADGPPLDEGFDIKAPDEPVEGGAKPPFDEFDFGLDDEQDDAEKEARAHAADGWGAREGEAPEGNTIGGAGEEAPVPYNEFSLTPDPAPPAKLPESAGTEKVIPFSTGYNKNGKAQKTGGNEENRFEDLFSRTLAEKGSEGAEKAVETDEDEDLEFDRGDLGQESGSTAAEEDPAPRHYAAGRGVMLAVLIFILGAGAVYFSGIIDTIARTLTGPDRTEVVEIETISGYMAENKNFGKFFVIEAKIKNTSDEAQTIDRITGIIYDSRGRSIATRSVSPGRVMTEDDLKNLTKDELLGQFSDSSGGVIPPKGTVPVMVPFTEIPAGLAEYGLKIVRE